MHTDMTRVNAIWQHPLYQQNLKDLIHLEADRIFCRHTPEHFLDVARLAYIFALERGLDCSRELIYCTALLHDIGRVRQYMDGTPHDEAGVQIAEQILSDLAFSSAEKEQILTRLRPGAVLGFPGHVMIYLGKTGQDYYVISQTGHFYQKTDTGFEKVTVNSCVVNSLSVYRKNEKTWLNSLTYCLLYDF